MERQHLKLMDMIAAIVGALDNREMFQSIISHSGRQHAQFGARPFHFAAFGDALIWGLEQQFGAAFTPELLQETLSRGLIRNLGLVRFRCKEGLSGRPRPPFGHAHKDRDEERKGELRPASDRNEHYPVTYIDPRGGSTPHP